MNTLLHKLIRLIQTRPLQLYPTARGFILFSVTHFFGRIFFRPDHGITLGQNVRLQRLRCLSAERPSATIKIGSHSIVYENAKLEAYGQGQLILGENCIIGDARIYSRLRVQLGSRVVTSWNVFIQDFDPHPVDPSLRKIQTEQMCAEFRPRFGGNTEPVRRLKWDFPAQDVIIGNDVWIGANVSILKGAQIGDGCVIATGSVVTAGIYPAGSLLGGIPAKVIRSLLEKAEVLT